MSDALILYIESLRGCVPDKFVETVLEDAGMMRLVFMFNIGIPFFVNRSLASFRSNAIPLVEHPPDAPTGESKAFQREHVLG